MRIVFAGHKERGTACLSALLAAGHEIVAVVAHPDTTTGVVSEAIHKSLRLFQPADVNAPSVVAELARLQPQVIVLAGYGPIVGQPFLDTAPFGAVNLHGGRLPHFRGSSPLNWALIRGEREFSISIIQVDRGIDSGDVIAERTFSIGPDDTIADLHAQANEAFPTMLVAVLGQLETGTVRRRTQNEGDAAYYPLRFPDDGLVVWDAMSAQEIHNRVRALTDPYPGAFTYLDGRQVRLLGSKHAKRLQYGEPGRIYLKNENGLLVCAADRCLWITRASIGNADAIPIVERYQRFATLRGTLANQLSEASK